MRRNSVEENARYKTAIRLRSVTSAESMNITAQLIDDVVLTYWTSLKQKYPSYSFEELIQVGHKELFLNERRKGH